MEQGAHRRDNSLRPKAAQQVFLGAVADADDREPGRVPRYDPGRAVGERDGLLRTDA